MQPVRLITKRTVVTVKSSHVTWGNVAVKKPSPWLEGGSAAAGRGASSRWIIELSSGNTLYFAAFPTTGGCR